MNGAFTNSTNFNQNITGWDVSNVTNFNSVFNGASSFSQDLSLWNVGLNTTVTTIRTMFTNADSFNHDISGWNLTGCSNMGFVFWNNNLFDQDLSAWDITSVTDFLNFGLDANFSVANWSSMLESWEAQIPNSNLTININAGYTETAVDSGTTDGTTANKLVDSIQNFLTTVSIGDIVHNTTDNTYAEVTAIDSDTQLTLDNDIMVSGETYVIQSSNAAKARYSLLNTYSWTINDGGAV
jgi:hypothetical protein